MLRQLSDFASVDVFRDANERRLGVDLVVTLQEADEYVETRRVSDADNAALNDADAAQQVELLLLRLAQSEALLTAGQVRLKESAGAPRVPCSALL